MNHVPVLTMRLGVYFFIVYGYTRYQVPTRPQAKALTQPENHTEWDQVYQT